jgi:YesN/AraC family two-component response regulator
VLVATNGIDALALLDSHAGPVHLMIADVVMPGLNVGELAASIGPRHPETRVLFMSGYTDDTVMRHGVAPDGAHFIGKPFTTTELKVKVRDVLDAKPPKVSPPR